MSVDEVARALEGDHVTLQGVREPGERERGGGARSAIPAQRGMLELYASPLVQRVSEPSAAVSTPS